MTNEEEARVKQFSPPWLSTLITVLAEAGLRVRKEALPLKWSDIDLGSEPGCIRVRDSKTAAGVRPVWLTKHCRNTLIQWRSSSVRDFLSTFSRVPEFLLRTSATTKRVGRKPHVRQEFLIGEFTIFAHHLHPGQVHATLQALQSHRCLATPRVHHPNLCEAAR